MSVPFDENLIKRCIQGEAKAQKQLYDYFSRVLYGICLRYSQNPDDAKDILQEGFIKIFSKISQYSGKGSFEGWIKRVMVNTALEFYRTNKVHTGQSDVYEQVEISFSSFSLEKISQKELLIAMNNLALGYKTVLNLYAIEGYSHAEIAEMLGISEGTSKSQLSRARVAFAAELKKLNIHIEKDRQHRTI